MIRKTGLVSEERFLERENLYITRMKEICRNMNIKLTESLSIKSGKAFATQVIHADLKKYPENEKCFPKEIWNSVNAFYRTCINNEDSPFFLNQTKDYPNVEEIADIIKRQAENRSWPTFMVILPIIMKSFWTPLQIWTYWTA